jgi:serine/threonine protein kinase
MDKPAEQLLGLTLDKDWKVIEKVATPPGATGGYFSVCYIVEAKDGTKAFLKALDFSKALEEADPARFLQAMTEAYNFERDLLAKCNESKMDRVLKAIGDGSVRIPEAGAVGAVQYLIFELADKDVRLHLALSKAIDTAWKLRRLHHVATGLLQLHLVGIAHQDLKPSNVLVFDEKSSKVGDLGRAAYDGRSGPWDGLPCAGDRTYAPPELLYDYIDPNWKKRRFGCDLYLLGSMVTFFFTGCSANALLTTELPDAFRHENWGGSFEDVLPYLRDAFGRFIESFSTQIPDAVLRAELKAVVSQLCDPDPRQRGVPPAKRGLGSPYSLERYVSKFDLLARRAEMNFYRS